MRTLAVVLTGLACCLVACGEETDAGAGAASLKGRSFLSTAVTEDGKAKQLVPKTRVRLQFADDGRLLADAGCNSMQGPVSTGDGKLALTELSTTQMGCDGPRHTQDEWLAGFLQAKPSWQLESDRLTLTAGTRSLVFQDQASTAPPLEGTRWSVDTLVNGQTASHPVGVEKAYLTISGDRVTGSTGCNDFQGRIARDGDKLTFGELGLTRKACAEPASSVEQAVVGVLKGDLTFVTFVVKGNKLSLRTADGTSGLDLVAR